MAIIIEGPDNAGKTTLVNYLSDKLKMPSFHAGGPPATNKLALQNCREQLFLCNYHVILDRVTPISRQVYENRYKDTELSDYLKRMIDLPNNVLVYCRPCNEVLMDMSSHEVKAHDTEAHLAYVMENHQNIVELYDRLMISVPHIHYDWTEEQNIDLLVKNLYLSQIDGGFCKNLTNIGMRS